MNITICDDVPSYIEEAITLIDAWAAPRFVDVSYTSFSRIDDLRAYLDTAPPVDVLLLDISFDGDDNAGMEFAKRLRAAGNQVPIIFLTDYAMLSRDGYLVEAVGFVLKSTDANRLSVYLDRVYERSLRKRPIEITTIDNDTVLIPRDELCYAMADDHYVHLYTMHKKYTTRLRLADLLDILDDNGFVRVHNSYVVSMSKVSSIKSTHPRKISVQVGDEIKSLPISRAYGDYVLQSYANNILES